jgi:hypothetical protein
MQTAQTVSIRGKKYNLSLEQDKVYYKGWQEIKEDQEGGLYICLYNSMVIYLDLVSQPLND